jgi:hypothetical protein
MKRLLFAAASAVLLMSGAAHASITPVLETIAPDGSNFAFDYNATLSGDEGLTTGSELVIFDFAGYVPGSIFSTSPNFVATIVPVANFDVTTGGVQANPMFTDDPTIPDLVFTYIGPDFQTTGGPFAQTSLGTMGASSTLAGFTLDGFSARAISNDGMGTIGTDSFNNGAVGVAAAVIGAAAPEPASWAMLIVGFGGAGALLRLKRRSALA